MQTAILLENLPYRHLFFTDVKSDVNSSHDKYMHPSKHLKNINDNDLKLTKPVESINQVRSRNDESINEAPSIHTNINSGSTDDDSICSQNDRNSCIESLNDEALIEECTNIESIDDDCICIRNEINKYFVDNVQPYNIIERFELYFSKVRPKINIIDLDLLNLEKKFEFNKIIPDRDITDRSRICKSHIQNDDTRNDDTRNDDTRNEDIDTNHDEQTLSSINLQSRTIREDAEKLKEISKNDSKDKSFNLNCADTNSNISRQLLTRNPNVSQQNNNDQQNNDQQNNDQQNNDQQNNDQQNNDQQETVMVRFGSTHGDVSKKVKDLRWQEDGLCVVFSDPVVCATYEANDLAEDLRKLQQLLDSLDRN